MQDTSLDPTGADADTEHDLAVDIDTLSIDGVRPKVGDTVTLKVGGTINQLKNNTAFITPDTVNDQPMPADTPDTVITDQSLLDGAAKADAMPMRY